MNSEPASTDHAPSGEPYHISTVRKFLIDQARALRTAKPEDLKVELERSKALSSVAEVIVDSARVEVEYLRATNQASTPFLEVPPDRPYIGVGSESSQHVRTELPAPGNGITSIVQHRLKE
jgi:hypothetical protein